MSREPRIIPREAGPMPTEPAAILALLAAGKLEQSCPRCGRWEAAHRYCSWCYRRMGPPDWYRNGAAEDREARRPSAVPANPPPEFRRVDSWPTAWGECPYQRPASPRVAGQIPSEALEADEAVVPPETVATMSATGGLLDVGR